MEQSIGDLTIGLIGAAVTALAALCWRISSAKIAHSRAVRRYPISATYLSSYTDDLDGVVRTVKDEGLEQGSPRGDDVGDGGPRAAALKHIGLGVKVR